jgi:hypothetical protein
MASSLASRLQIKPGQGLRVLNAPHGMLGTLQFELPGIEVGTEGSGPVDAVLLFVGSLAELAFRLGGAVEAVLPGGPFWIAYPKGSSGVATDVNRDRLWAAIEPSGWRPVRQIALDETWTAMRFRPAEMIGR